MKKAQEVTGGKCNALITQKIIIVNITKLSATRQKSASNRTALTANVVRHAKKIAR
jgi:hypothetical protein